MSGALEDTSFEDFKQQMDVNFFAAVNISKVQIRGLSLCFSSVLPHTSNLF
jgi:hypothetical protein